MEKIIYPDDKLPEKITTSNEWKKFKDVTDSACEDIQNSMKLRKVIGIFGEPLYPLFKNDTIGNAKKVARVLDTTMISCKNLFIKSIPYDDIYKEIWEILIDNICKFYMKSSDISDESIKYIISTIVDKDDKYQLRESLANVILKEEIDYLKNIMNNKQIFVLGRKEVTPFDIKKFFQNENCLPEELNVKFYLFLIKNQSLLKMSKLIIHFIPQQESYVIVWEEIISLLKKENQDFNKKAVPILKVMNSPRKKQITRDQAKSNYNKNMKERGEGIVSNFKVLIEQLPISELFSDSWVKLYEAINIEKKGSDTWLDIYKSINIAKYGLTDNPYNLIQKFFYRLNEDFLKDKESRLSIHISVVNKLLSNNVSFEFYGHEYFTNILNAINEKSSEEVERLLNEHPYLKNYINELDGLSK